MEETKNTHRILVKKSLENGHLKIEMMEGNIEIDLGKYAMMVRGALQWFGRSIKGGFGIGCDERYMLYIYY
jgi:hypothetical protein